LAVSRNIVTSLEGKVVVFVSQGDEEDSGDTDGRYAGQRTSRAKRSLIPSLWVIQMARVEKE